MGDYILQCTMDFSKTSARCEDKNGPIKTFSDNSDYLNRKSSIFMCNGPASCPFSKPLFVQVAVKEFRN